MTSLLSHFTPRNAPFLFLQRETRFHIFLTRNGWGEERFLFLRILPGTDPVEAGWGLQLRGLEHVATNHGVGGSNPSSPTTDPKAKGRTFPLWEQENHDRDSGPKAMELGYGSFVEVEWVLLFFTCYHNIFQYSIPRPPAYFFCFMPRTPSSARLGQNSRASTSISSIAKMRSSSLICFMFARGNCSLSGESMTASKMHCQYIREFLIGQL